MFGWVILHSNFCQIGSVTKRIVMDMAYYLTEIWARPRIYFLRELMYVRT